MTIEFILFYGFAILSIGASIMVISAKNPIHSIFYLVLVFLNSAGLFIILGVEFIAIIFIIVYVGAIAILFLFVVMMLNIKLIELYENMLRYLPIGALIAIIFFFEIFLLLENDGHLTILSYNIINDNYKMIDWNSNILNLSNIENIGFPIYTYYFHLFWIAGLVLLVAMIGAIVLTLYLQINVKTQDVFKQSSRHFSKSILLKL
jgi:NADH-quinone oxidoreductase subunit J